MIEIKLGPKAFKIYAGLMYSAILLISLNWTLSIVPVYYRPYETVVDSTIVLKLNQLKNSANIKESIEIRRYWTSVNDNFNLWVFRDHSNRAIIYIDNRFNSNVSDKAMSAVFAHELGHLAKGHCPQGFQTPKEISELDTEIQADAFAVQLVGNEVFLEGFTELMGSWGITVRSPQKRLEDAELYLTQTPRYAVE